MTQDWAMFINSQKPFHCVYFDQKSAFDRVDHTLLLEKMAAIGIHANTLSWFKAYLSHRSYRVRVDSDLSNPRIAHSGVPQGSCASPLLYTIFVLDINRYLPVSVKYLGYADDLKIYCAVDTPDSHKNLQMRWMV